MRGKERRVELSQMWPDSQSTFEYVVYITIIFTYLRHLTLVQL